MSALVQKGLITQKPLDEEKTGSLSAAYLLNIKTYAELCLDRAPRTLNTFFGVLPYVSLLSRGMWRRTATHTPGQRRLISRTGTMTLCLMGTKRCAYGVSKVQGVKRSDMSCLFAWATPALAEALCVGGWQIKKGPSGLRSPGTWRQEGAMTLPDLT